MNILDNEPAMTILREAADKLGAIGIAWDMQAGLSPHGASIALIASETEEGVSAGYVASFFGNELANGAPKRFAQEVADHLANRAVEKAKRLGK
ncbi:hypothetical protein LMG22037_05931 [Paraburkholderia phenoliruptrix]|uniref:Uncharacterized protein n=1 Tax=Paraburkholderia phenoliruptrix TaxID=252970 RepID=A0A6J5CEX8_9BURK|nr:hypothetical protein [Paraburkholderia phenoliruptrix]CAB3735085.1 hypothetical protein LMG22037_05931 [Paraburkholderia phenoliruptrix]